MTSCIIGIPLFAAIIAPISLPFGDADITIVPSQTELIAEDQALPSNRSKQSPLTEITFSTPFIFDASEAPFPLGQITVESPPIFEMAPIN